MKNYELTEEGENIVASEKTRNIIHKGGKSYNLKYLTDNDCKVLLAPDGQSAYVREKKGTVKAS